MKTVWLATVIVAALAGSATADPAATVAAPPAQTASSASAPATSAAPLAPALACCRVTDGMVIKLELVEALNSRDKKVGDMFAIRLVSPVMAGDTVVIPAGVTGMGQVIDVDQAGLMGKPAKIVLAARYLENDGVRVPIRTFRLGGNGEDRTQLVAAVGAAVGIVSVLIPGGNVEYPAGTRGSAKIAKDMVLAPMKAPEVIAAAVPAALPASPVASGEKRTTQ